MSTQFGTALAAMVLLASASQAGITVNVTETGGDVVFSTSGGSLDVSSGSKSDTNGGAFIAPSSREFVVGAAPGNVSLDQYSVTMTKPSAFGSGGLAGPTAGSGDLFGIVSNTVIVPDNYVSGDPIGASSMTFSGATLASLGMTPGTYIWSWPGDSITLNVGFAPVTWYLQDVTTTGGERWTGSFDYDAGSNTFLNIQIASTVVGFPMVDSISTDAQLAVGCTDPATASGVTLGPDSGGFTIFCMDFAAALTGAGGTVNLVTGTPGWATGGQSENITGGSVTTELVTGKRTVDFADSVGTSSSFTSRGMDFNSSSGNIISYRPIHYEFWNLNSMFSFTMTETSSQPFDLNELFVYAPTDSGTNDVIIDFTGNLQGGGTVTKQVVLNAYNFGGGNTDDDPQTVLFDGTWTNLTSVDVDVDPTNTGFAATIFDNIVVTSPPLVNVDIDIMSGLPGNKLHPHHNDVNVSPFLDDIVKVGVLGSLISAGDPIDFATDDIDTALLAFGTAQGGESSSQFNQNVDADGIEDAVFDFPMSVTGIACGETTATLTGETTAGQAFEGSDTISTDCGAVCH